MSGDGMRGEIVDIPAALLDDAPALAAFAAGRRVDVLLIDPLAGVVRVRLTSPDDDDDGAS
jgi:hypothetical protein